jgi:hypothetical protein
MKKLIDEANIIADNREHRAREIYMVEAHE